MYETTSGARYARGMLGSLSKADWEWYDSIGLALRILGKHWYDDVTKEEDEFILAFADEVSPRPVHEQERP